jgi:hypothetical protein
MRRRCQYAGCREPAVMVVEVIRDRHTIWRRLCRDHVEQAKAIALQYGGIAYRLEMS